jgi:hypothetical protein
MKVQTLGLLLEFFDREIREVSQALPLELMAKELRRRSLSEWLKLSCRYETANAMNASGQHLTWSTVD